MATDKPVTEKRLIAILKDFRKNLNIDFLETLTSYHNGEVIPRLDKIGERLDRIELELSFIKQDVKDLKAELALTISKKDYAKLHAIVLSLQEELDDIKKHIGLA